MLQMLEVIVLFFQITLTNLKLEFHDLPLCSDNYFHLYSCESAISQFLVFLHIHGGSSGPAATIEKIGDTLQPGLTNSVNFTEIHWIRSPPNFKISDLLFMDSKYLKK
jgi:hypothetical protein